MNRLLGILALAIVVAQFTSCLKDETYPFTDTYCIINESSHQIFMSDIDSSVYPESINLDPSDLAVDNSNVWSCAYSYYDVYYDFIAAMGMTITIDGIHSYSVSLYPSSNSCKCKSGICKCGERTSDGVDVVCMCDVAVVNPCDCSNWVIASVEGAKIENGVIRISKKKKNMIVWEYTITEEMVEQTLSQLAEE